MAAGRGVRLLFATTLSSGVGEIIVIFNEVNEWESRSYLQENQNSMSA